MSRLGYHKGHATLNDFVIVEDQHGMHHLTPEFVAQLCDRRAGIGGDGVLRVVRAQHIPEWEGDPELWFMDYRNADGSVAEMCGNGLRLFARHLMNEQLVPVEEQLTVATRAGLKQVRPGLGDEVAVNLGEVAVADELVRVVASGQSFDGVPVDVGNPHLVSFVGPGVLDALDLGEEPRWEPRERFPNGVNLEFVAELAPGQLRMRVHERGSGETMSCGTGVVASAAVHRREHPELSEVQVSVPGGDLTVRFEPDGAWLVGPAVVTCRGEYWG